MTPDDGSVGWMSAGIHDVPADDGWDDSALSARLGRMPYAKRSSEVRLGRWAAKVAIARTLGLPVDLPTLRTVVVRNAFDGAPEAYVHDKPIDAVIAMTDRADWAVCAVVRGQMRVGCDLELVEPRSAAFVSDYLTGIEQETVANSAEPDLTANLIWSAKESALKVLRTGLRRDTRTVEVKLPSAGTAGWQPLEVNSVEGRTFPGWWARFGQFVLTVATEEATSPPISLVSPIPLQSAVPSHRWMMELRRP